jgi:hypothetical protein
MKEFCRKHKHTIWKIVTLFLETGKSMCRINTNVQSRTENHSFTVSYLEDRAVGLSKMLVPT